jgi:hypothetical protein
MRKRGTMIEMEVNIYATNLTEKWVLRKPIYSNEWRISETDSMPTASVTCGVKTENWRLKRIETDEESVMSYWQLWAGNLIPN